jgi:hypothetical protein
LSDATPRWRGLDQSAAIADILPGHPAPHRARAPLSNAQYNQRNKPNTDHQYREGERIVFEPTGNHGATLFKLISFKDG